MNNNNNPLAVFTAGALAVIAMVSTATLSLLLNAPPGVTIPLVIILAGMGIFVTQRVR